MEMKEDLKSNLQNCELICAFFEANICKQACKSRSIVLLKQNNNNTVGKRAPKFQADGSGGGGAQDQRHLGAVQQQNRSDNKRQEKLHKAGDGQGNEDSHKQERIAKVVEKERSVIMASAAKVAKRIPLIKFPNRKAGEGQGSQAVSRASGGGGSSQAMPSLPSGTASSQPPRTKLSEAEIEAILLGGAAP